MFRANENGFDVEVGDFVVFVDCVVFEFGRGGDAGVVDQDVDFAEFFFHGFEGGFDLFFVREGWVETDDLVVCVFLFKAFEGFFHGFFARAEDRDFRAVFEKSPGSFEADAAGAAGDDCNFVV